MSRPPPPGVRLQLLPLLPEGRLPQWRPLLLLPLPPQLLPLQPLLPQQLPKERLLLLLPPPLGGGGGARRAAALPVGGVPWDAQGPWVALLLPPPLPKGQLPL